MALILRDALGEDGLKYADFFSKAPVYNSLNQVPKLLDPQPGFFEKMTRRQQASLILQDDLPTAYLLIHRYSHVNRIECLIHEARPNLSLEETCGFIRKEIFDQVTFILKNNPYEIQTVDQPDNRLFLQTCGFKPIKEHQVMVWGKNDLQTHALPAGLTCQAVVGPADVKDRVLIQNEAFDNKNRVPLNLVDVMSEMKSGSYLKDLALLLRWQGDPVAYGQIIRHNNLYYLVNFGVRPKYRGKGLSHWLLSDLLKGAVAAGIGTILLEVFESNRPAIELYGKHGFRKQYSKVHWRYENRL